jgi:hypothetical protein
MSHSDGKEGRTIGTGVYSGINRWLEDADFADAASTPVAGNTCTLSHLASHSSYPERNPAFSDFLHFWVVPVSCRVIVLCALSSTSASACLNALLPGQYPRPRHCRTVFRHTFGSLDYADIQSLPGHVIHFGVEDELDGSCGFSRQFRGMKTESWFSLTVPHGYSNVGSLGKRCVACSDLRFYSA